MFVICLVSLVVFGFLGIFFGEYRALARESLDCLSQRMRTGRCDADFEAKVKSTVVGKALERDQRLARFLNRHLEKVTWVLLGLMILAGYFAFEGIYNLWVHGNCNGPQATTGCAFNSSLFSGLKTSIEGFVLNL